MTERVQGVVTRQGNDVSDLCNRLGEAHGCPPRVLVACGIGESDLDERAERFGTWPDVSFGLCQQTVAYAPMGDQTGSVANISIVRAALFDVVTALETAAPQLAGFWQQYGDGPETLGRYNWPAKGLQGNPNRANIERAWAASAQYLAPEEAATVTYDPNTPPERQRQPWSCSIRTATWMLRALGVDIDAGRMQDVLVPDYVTPALGLLQGDGSGLAAVLADQSGLPTGHAWVSWEWLCAHAGTMPIGIGSPSLYHWVAVRGLNEDGTLALANPAPGYQGLYDTMSEAQFQQWTPWAGVWIEVPQEEEDALSAEEKQELADLRSLKTYTDALVGAGGILPSALGTLEAAASGKSSRAELANIVRGQTAAIRAAAGI